jgi:DNA-binding MurR/RpiR family transcriptional regulator
MHRNSQSVSDLQSLIDRLTAAYPDLSPQLRQAARFILDTPTEVAIKSMRRVAAEAGVAPSTMLRLAKAIDYANYEIFRKPFQEAMRDRGSGFGSRAKWLQQLAERSDSGALLSSMARADIANVESAFQSNEPKIFVRAAKRIRTARQAFVVGTGGAYGFAHYFHYVGRMALPNLRMASVDSGSLIDDLVDLQPSDAIVAVAMRPYSSATVRAAAFARDRGARVIAITDSRSSPLSRGADCLLLTPTQSPQFFPSYTAAVAVLETLAAFIVSGGDNRTVAKIADVERFRHDADICWDESAPE